MTFCTPYTGQGGQQRHSELLFSILLEFWLTDGEEPSLNQAKDSRLPPALPYEAPTRDLLAAMQVACPKSGLTKYHTQLRMHSCLLQALLLTCLQEFGDSAPVRTQLMYRQTHVL